MMLIIIAIVTFIASGLTLFSGFGLGTLLSPVLMLFFSPAIAIALTAVVHLLNNLFKLAIFYKEVNWNVALRFGIPAIVAAFLGAFLLKSLSSLSVIYSYEIGTRSFEVTPIKLVISCLIIIFVFLEASPKFNQWRVSEKFLPLGGILSGFLGGLSGHQGALRSAFLIKCNLTKDSFIATGIIIACLIDISRLIIYTSYLKNLSFETHGAILTVAGVASFCGVFIGSKLLKKVTMLTVQRIVSVMLIIIAVLLGCGII